MFPVPANRLYSLVSDQRIVWEHDEILNADFYFDFVTALWLGFTGACIGSFLNVVAYRWPLGMSVVWRSSHCPKCASPIRARDNVPVFGWLMLRGKCRDCGAPISPRYAIVEAIMGLVFFVLAYIELFSGGRGLSENRGAALVVWNPDWPIIGLYVFHCLLASVAVTLVLMRLDKNISNERLITGTAIVVALWPLPWWIL
jgi:leader peptidase (prepilin peptidase) / N-methyltransferase